MDDFLGKLAGLSVDLYLQYPVSCCSVGFCYLLYKFYPAYDNTEATKGWKWVASRVTVFVLLSILSTLLIPVLAMAPDRIILRPTPSCSTFDNPVRYICFSLNEQHHQVFYTTTWRKCDSSDPNMSNATRYYITSSWIPSFDHFVTIKSVIFQPESLPDENKTSYSLPENYCVRAAGPSGGERQKVAFYSISGSRRHLLDSGFINSSLLKKFSFGWYLVSNCKSELSRWLFHCTQGYVSSHYVRLPQYMRGLLLEQREQNTN